jgi:hypothetical protein
MVLLPTANGWQASVRGVYRGSKFVFVFLVSDHLTGMRKLRTAMADFMAFIDEGEPS